MYSETARGGRGSIYVTRLPFLTVDDEFIFRVVCYHSAFSHPSVIDCTLLIIVVSLSHNHMSWHVGVAPMSHVQCAPHFRYQISRISDTVQLYLANMQQPTNTITHGRITAFQNRIQGTNQPVSVGVNILCIPLPNNFLRRVCDVSDEAMPASALMAQALRGSGAAGHCAWPNLTGRCTAQPH